MLRPMTMLSAALVLGLLVAPAAPEAAKKAPPTKEQVDKMIRDALNGAGSGFDGCTNRYMKEYPKTKAVVQLALKVGEKGKVVSAEASTNLPGARVLRPCLERVAKTVRFPEPQGTASLSVSVPVESGAKFKLYGPNEKPPASAKGVGTRNPVRFLPGNWQNIASPPSEGK